MTRPPWLWRGMLAEHGVTEGRLLRRIDRWGHISEKLHPGPVYDLSKRLVAAVGLEKDAEGRVFTANGWRASGRSAARDAGASAEAADRHGRWKPGSQAGRGYERDRGEYGDHPMVKVAAEQRRTRTAVPVPARPEAAETVDGFAVVDDQRADSKGRLGADGQLAIVLPDAPPAE
ncbi:hypothetical protein ACW14Y_04170 [Kitasatospora sp. cg17-2]